MHIIASDVIKSATLAATSTASGFLVDNLKNDKRSSTWRSTAIASQTITATWGSSQVVNAIGIAFANFLVDSTVQARLFTNTGDVSPVVDSGVQTISFVYPPPAGFDANNLASFAYGGGNYFFLPVTQSSIRKMEIVLTNPSGADAFIEMARIVAGEALEISSGMSFGSEVGIKELTRVDRTDAGNLIIDRRPVSKSISLDLSLMASSDRSAMQAIVRRNGAHTPVFISAYEAAANVPMKMDYQIYGNFMDLNGMVLDSAAYSSLRLKVEEI